MAMTGIEPFVNPTAGGLVKIVMDLAKAVGGSVFSSIKDSQQAKAALKKYADKYQSRYGLLKLLGMPDGVQLEKVYTNVRFLDGLSIRRFESIEAMEQDYRESGQRQFQIGRETKLDGVGWPWCREVYLSKAVGTGGVQRENR